MNKTQSIVIWIIKPLLLSILVLSLTLPVLAEDKHPIDKSLGECLHKSKSITSEMVECLEGAHEKWESEMDKHYSLLMGILGEESKIKLEKSQSAWEKYRDLEFEFIPYYFIDPGSYIGPAIAEHKMNIIKARALQLQAYYRQAKEGRELMEGLDQNE